MGFHDAIDHELHRSCVNPIVMVFLARRLDRIQVFSPQLGRIEKISNIHADGEIPTAAKFVEEVKAFKILTGTMNTRDPVLIGPFHSCAQSRKLFSARRLWDDPRDDLLSRFFQGAGGFASLRITNDNAVRPIWRFTSYARKSESLGIGPVSMTVIAFEKDRPVGEKFVEVLLVRKRLGYEHGVIPASSENPITPGMLRCVLAEPLLDIGNIFCALKVYTTQAQGAVEKMDVTIGKAGKYKS